MKRALRHHVKHLGSSLTISLIGLFCVVPATSAATITASPTHAQQGQLTVEPVLLPYCPPNSETCPKYEFAFPYPYKLRIYRQIGTLEVLAYSLNTVGPGNVNIMLDPGQYIVQYHAGQLKTEYPSVQTVLANQHGLEPLKLHFIMPAHANYFIDYNGCSYTLPGDSAGPTFCLAK